MLSGLLRRCGLACAASAVVACDSGRSLTLETDDPLFALGASGAPSDLTASLAAGPQIHLRWVDNTPNEDAFEVERSKAGGGFTVLKTTPPNTTAYTDAQLEPETAYCYRIRASRTTGRKVSYSTYSPTACATTGPRAASNVKAVAASSSVVDVSWSDNSDTESGFRVERAGAAAGPWSAVSTTAANVVAYRADGQASEQTVCYRAIAFNAQAEAPPSAAACTAPPAAPSNVVAAGLADGHSIDVTWTDNSSVEDGYTVERAAPDRVWTVAVDLPAGRQSYRDAGLTTDTRYSYRVRARKDGGYSDYSPEATAVVSGTVPVAPSIVRSWPYTSTSIIVAWMYEPANEDGFRVERSTDGGANWTPVHAVDRLARGLYDEGRSPDERVDYRVFAVNGKGDSPASAVTSMTPPRGPTDLSATTGADFSIVLTWSDNSNVEDAYEVQRLYCYQYYYYYGYFCEYLTHAVLERGSMGYRDEGLNPGEFYQYRVLARKYADPPDPSRTQWGYSDASNEAGAWADLPPAGSVRSNRLIPPSPARQKPGARERRRAIPTPR